MSEHAGRRTLRFALLAFFILIAAGDAALAITRHGVLMGQESRLVDMSAAAATPPGQAAGVPHCRYWTGFRLMELTIPSPADSASRCPLLISLAQSIED